jgi:predicted transcriptional regulator
MKYRSRADIIALILQASMNGGATKTRLMYRAFLSYAQIQEYLQLLTSKGLIMQEAGTQVFKLTEKGLRFIRSYDQISDVLAVDGAASSTPQEQTVSAAHQW